MNSRTIVRTGALVARCPTARELVMDPLVVATATGFLDHASAVQLHLTQIIDLMKLVEEQQKGLLDERQLVRAVHGS